MTHRLFTVLHISGKRAFMVSTEGMTLEQALEYARGQFGRDKVVEVTV